MTLKKSQVIIGVIIAIMINNLWHSVMVYVSLSGDTKSFAIWQFIMSFISMLTLDISVILSVMYSREGKNDEKISLVFAWVLFLVNFFYWEGVSDLYSPIQTFSNPQKATLFITKIMFSGVFAFTIHHFSYLYRDLRNQEQQTSKLEQELSTIKQGMSESKQRTEQVLATAQQTHSEHEQLRQLVQQRTKQDILLNELQTQLAEAHKETARINALYQIDIAERTLYSSDNERLMQSAKAVIGALGGMPDADREYHLAMKKQVIESYQAML